jgi:hypothetical protein
MNKPAVLLLLQLGIVLVAAAVPALAGMPTITPEPASIILIGGGIGTLILIARWKRARK